MPIYTAPQLTATGMLNFSHYFGCHVFGFFFVLPKFWLVWRLTLVVSQTFRIFQQAELTPIVSFRGFAVVICVLLGCYTAYLGNWCPGFRDIFVDSSPRVSLSSDAAPHPRKPQAKFTFQRTYFLKETGLSERFEFSGSWCIMTQWWIESAVWVI